MLTIQGIKIEDLLCSIFKTIRSGVGPGEHSRISWVFFDVKLIFMFMFLQRITVWYDLALIDQGSFNLFKFLTLVCCEHCEPTHTNLQVDT